MAFFLLGSLSRVFNFEMCFYMYFFSFQSLCHTTIHCLLLNVPNMDLWVLASNIVAGEHLVTMREPRWKFITTWMWPPNPVTEMYISGADLDRFASDLDPFPCPGVLPLHIVASDRRPAILTWRLPLDGDVVLVTVSHLRLAGTTRLVWWHAQTQGMAKVA